MIFRQWWRASKENVSNNANETVSLNSFSFTKPPNLRHALSRYNSLYTPRANWC